MARAISFGMGVAGLEVWIDYNEANNRILSVSWSIPASGTVARAQVWNNDQLVVDRTVGGPASGTHSIPGNLRMVEVTENGQTFLDLPPNITYQFNVETIG